MTDHFALLTYLILLLITLDAVLIGIWLRYINKY